MLCSRVTLRNSDLQGSPVPVRCDENEDYKSQKITKFCTCKIEQGADSWVHRCEPAATGNPPASGSSWSCLGLPSPSQIIRMK